MSVDSNLLFLVIAFLAVALFLAVFPLKNWLEIKSVREKERRWVAWLNEKPTRAQYCETHQQKSGSVTCDFCGSDRQMPSLEMVITHNPRFGFINNSFNKYSHFKTFICSGCGTELFRERYEE